MEQNSVNKVETFAEFAGESNQPAAQQDTPPTEPAIVSVLPKESEKVESQAQEEKGSPSSESTKAPEQTTSVVRAPIGMDESGIVVARTLEEQFRYAAQVCRSGLVPAAFNTPEKVMVGMQFAAELGLRPISALRQIYVVNGLPSLWGDLPLALCRRSGQLDVFEEWFIDSKSQRIKEDDYTSVVFGAVCRAKRTGRPEVKRGFTRTDAETAGVWGKKVWAVYPKRMLQMRSRSWALKDEFGDVLHGVAIAEYDYDTIPGTDPGIQVDRPRSAASALNQRFSAQQESIEAEAVIEKTN